MPASVILFLEEKMETALLKSQTISVTNLKTFTMSGVIDIAAFDGEYVLLNTSLGKISVEGQDLKIQSLIKESGEILVTGEITGVFVTPVKEKKRLFFSK